VRLITTDGVAWSAVCLFASISLEAHIQSSPKFLGMLVMAVAGFYAGSVAIGYVFLVVLMTLFLHTRGQHRTSGAAMIL